MNTQFNDKFLIENFPVRFFHDFKILTNCNTFVKAINEFTEKLALATFILVLCVSVPTKYIYISNSNLACSAQITNSTMKTKWTFVNNWCSYNDTYTCNVYTKFTYGCSGYCSTNHIIVYGLIDLEFSWKCFKLLLFYAHFLFVKYPIKLPENPIQAGQFGWTAIIFRMNDSVKILFCPVCVCADHRTNVRFLIVCFCLFVFGEFRATGSDLFTF